MTKKTITKLLIIIFGVIAIGAQAQTASSPPSTVSYKYEHSTTGNVESRVLGAFRMAQNETEDYEEEIGKPVFTMYPNPAISEFTLAFTEDMVKDKTASVQVYNALGQQLYHAETQNQITTISIEGYEPGMYYVEVISGEKRWVKELVVTN